MTHKSPSRFFKLLLAVALIMSGASSISQAQQAVNNLRLWHSPSGTRVVFDVSADVSHNVFKLDNPKRLVIDINDANLAVQLPEIEGNDFILGLRTGVPKRGVLRFVFDLKQAVRVTSFVLSPNELYGHRLVVDIEQENSVPSSNPPSPRTEEEAESQTSVAAEDRSNPDPTVNVRELPSDLINKQFVVAIDAGHGGEDPGALGHQGSREKQITLAIANKLSRIVNQDAGMSARLIRTGDYFINLQQRRRMAREQGADVFVSIHADAFKKQSARGFSVFALSQSGATSAMAAALADQENASDLIGGVSLADKDEVLAKVLVDLSMNNTISESVNLGGRVLKELAKLGHLHSKRVEQAGFVVLKSADMPSILVETGFITNPSEESRLRTDSYQQNIAQAIYTALYEYRQQTPHFANANYVAPSINSANAASNTAQDAIVNHRVTRGDTLSELALRYGTTVAQIKSINGLRSDTAVLGQRLKIPTRRSTSASTSTGSIPDVHVVVSGDSLAKISARYNITIAALKRLNNLSSNTIVVGQKIALGGTSNAPPSTHVVKSGESLSVIADSYKLSVKELKRLNNLSGSTIRIGQTLKLR